MTLVNRSVLARQMREFVGGSTELVSLQRAMDLLHPGHPRPNLTEVVTSVMYSALRGHESHTARVLTRLNEAMGRTLEDLDALRRNEPIGGRTAGMRAADLTQIALAMEDLTQLEQRIRNLMETDRSWVQALSAELEASMLRPAAAAATPIVPRAPGRVEAAALSLSVSSGLARLQDAIHAVAPTGVAIWATRLLPARVRQAAHDLVVASGGDVRAAVHTAIRSGSDTANDVVIAILWAENRIQPRAKGLGAADFDLHQRSVTGLDFEWQGKLAPGQSGREIGLDGITDGVVVDAKNLSIPLVESAHVLGGATPRQPFSGHQRREVTPADLVSDVAEASRRVTPADRARVESHIELKQTETLEQMQRQLDWARYNGLDGIRWVCNAQELADYFNTIADRLPSGYRNMRTEFVVGGLTGGR